MVVAAILIGLIVSSFGEFRSKMNHAACSANLRALWMAAKEFSLDHDGRFTSLNIERSSGDANLKGFRDYLGYTHNVFNDTEYSCPEAQNDPEYAAGGYMFRSYSINRRLVHNWAAEGVATQVRDALSSFQHVKWPDQTFYLADGVPNPGSATKSGKGINYFTSLDYVNNQRAHFLHDSRINAVFVDGSVRSLDKHSVNKPKDHVIWGGEVRD